MRWPVGVIAVLAFGCLVAAGPAAAVDYPWCAEYDMEGPVTNCSFVSREQCRWTAFGGGGTCVQNPSYVAAGTQRQPKSKSKRSRN